ncbi:MAG: bifunctional UDP-N-acetylmuramoyl-tripeptide:D-alanyl-D-alanine ligase/alanine racemase [Terrimonas sp.]|nr:bifunctional UDP-N-acetylmuramoyl-tripeptide:D-alanyl-D-alanine ligase/alanine racemase [Terrimonas sp.]
MSKRNHTISEICSVIHGKLAGENRNNIIEYLVFDSRKLYFPASSLFFALVGERRDGHAFIDEVYRKGVCCFVVSNPVDTTKYPNALFICVDDTLVALQQLAAYHRSQFTIPVVGIAGSNGKTIVKEWLYQLLSPDYNIVRSPKSYNSQIGVPLSVWLMEDSHDLAIFEAGISRPGEMEKLAGIIQPGIGILTNIGDAHNEGFASELDKLTEKCRLFARCKTVIYPHDLPAKYGIGPNTLFNENTARFTWSRNDPNASLFIEKITTGRQNTIIEARYRDEKISIEILFTDAAAIENAITCWCFLLVEGYPQDRIKNRMLELTPVNMRLEFKKAINNCSIINDSYSADLGSLHIALNFLKHKSGKHSRTVILSDFLQSGIDKVQLYRQVAAELVENEVARVMAVGNDITQWLSLPASVKMETFQNTDEWIKKFRYAHFKDEVILVKGARSFAFEQIVQLLEQKTHQTVLEINLGSITHNLKEYQKLLRPSVKTMVMVKAFAYGSGGVEIATALQFHQVDYLGVAYADEGVELRKAGILLPIMVMNTEENSFDAIVEHHLEPVIYSKELMYAFGAFIRQEGRQHYPVHIEVETGMHRLGFSIDELQPLADFLFPANLFKVQSIFSHLASSEDPKEDNFTAEQLRIFKQIAAVIEKKIGYSCLKHIANSAAIVRNPALQLDMVRLGIGLYGVDMAAQNKVDLQHTATLITTIAQVTQLRKGDTVGYNRKGIISRESVIATVRIGYADGYPRKLGNAVGSMMVNGQLAPTIGAVCMDMTMIDITGIPGVKEGDTVIVFGKDIPLQQVAAWSGTIPYEIMTGISQRVKRVYFEE